MSIRRQQGMTLLEVMVALSIFSMISLAAYKVLSNVMSANVTVKASAENLHRIQQSYAHIERDMEQLVDRSVRISDELSSGPLVISAQGQQIDFTRGGRPNPLQLSRSSLLRVRYDIGLSPQDREDTQTYLRRFSWSVLDRNNEAKPFIQLLMPVESLSFLAITNKGRYDIWPADVLADNEQLIALSITATDVQRGELTRLIKVY